jgi:hypothetical protein
MTNQCRFDKTILKDRTSQHGQPGWQLVQHLLFTPHQAPAEQQFVPHTVPLHDSPRSTVTAPVERFQTRVPPSKCCSTPMEIGISSEVGKPRKLHSQPIEDHAARMAPLVENAPMFGDQWMEPPSNELERRPLR